MVRSRVAFVDRALIRADFDCYLGAASYGYSVARGSDVYMGLFSNAFSPHESAVPEEDKPESSGSTVL